MSVLISLLFIGCIAAVPRSITAPHVSAFAIKIRLAMIGRFFAHCACNGIYLWTFEFFPTVIRTQGCSVCTVVYRLSGAAASFRTSVLRNISVYLPYGIVFVMGVLAVFVGLSLPETRDLPTREKYEDIFSQPPLSIETVNMENILPNSNADGLNK